MGEIPSNDLTVYRGCVVQFEATGADAHLSVQAQVMKDGEIVGLVRQTESGVTVDALIQRVRAAAFAFIDSEVRRSDLEAWAKDFQMTSSSIPLR